MIDHTVDGKPLDAVVRKTSIGAPRSMVSMGEVDDVDNQTSFESKRPSRFRTISSSAARRLKMTMYRTISLARPSPSKLEEKDLVKVIERSTSYNNILREFKSVDLEDAAKDDANGDLIEIVLDDSDDDNEEKKTVYNVRQSPSVKIARELFDKGVISKREFKECMTKDHQFQEQVNLILNDDSIC